MIVLSSIFIAEYLLLVIVSLAAKCMPAFRLNVFLFCYGKNRILNSEDNPYMAFHTFTVSQSEILRRD